MAHATRARIAMTTSATELALRSFWSFLAATIFLVGPNDRTCGNRLKTTAIFHIETHRPKDREDRMALPASRHRDIDRYPFAPYDRFRVSRFRAPL